MDFSSPAPETTAFFIEEAGACLFGLMFLFLWRQSRVAYFGLWTIAWLFRFAATIFGFQLLRSTSGAWLALYAVFEFGFAIALIAAARAGFAANIKNWRTPLRLTALLPIFVFLVYGAGFLSHVEAYRASNALVLGFVYLYAFVALPRRQIPGWGAGARVFRFSLLVLAVVFLEHAILFIYLYNTGDAQQWTQYLYRQTFYDFTLHCLLAFSAMAMWSELQIDRIRELHSELDHVRRENKRTGELDGLTGLQNQSALARRVESGVEFPGVVAVCDMDDFKHVNDRFGHLVGDEILRNIGSLLQASIRHEDEAFRWGGDEFVILFLNQIPEIAAKRMAEVEGRLREFHVRGVGTLPMSMSWGTADARGKILREALDEADKQMYAVKRSRSSGSAREA